MIEETDFYNFVDIITSYLDKDRIYHNKICSFMWTEGSIGDYTDYIIYLMEFKHEDDLVNLHFWKLGSAAKLGEESALVSIEIFDREAEFESFLIRAQ